MLGIALLASLPALAGAEQGARGAAWTYRLVLTDELTGRRADPDRVPLAGEPWTLSNQWIGRGDGRLEWRETLTLGGGVAVRGASDGDTVLRVREAYARVSGLAWLELEAGKRLVRWGTGYAFTPTGVLDPPRDPADPQDRLGVNEGLLLARADVFRGPTAVTLAAAAPRAWRLSSAAAPDRLAAARLRTAVRGFEVALVARAASDQGPSWGANFTHVVGQRLEWHGELLAQPRRPPAPAAVRGRVVSGLIGLQYTFAAGLNVVVEYFHDGNGLSDAEWRTLRARPALAAARSRPTRRNVAFLRLSRAATEARVQPELIAVGALDDGSLTLVPAIAWRVLDRAQAHVRAVYLGGPAGSLGAAAPTRVTVSVGVTVSF